MPSDIQSVLERLYEQQQQQPGSTEHRAALEAELTDRFENLPTPAARAPSLRRRLAFGAVGLALAVGACISPSDYGVELGNRVGILVASDTFEDLDVHELVEHVREQYAPDQLEVEVRRERTVHSSSEAASVVDEVVRIQLEIVGDGIDADAVWAELVEAFPVLEGSRMEDMPMEAQVHGTLGGRLAHDYLDWIIDRHGVEEARRRILADLAAQGYAGKAQVEVSDGAEGRRVKVMVRAGGEDGEDVIEDEDVRVRRH